MHSLGSGSRDPLAMLECVRGAHVAGWGKLRRRTQELAVTDLGPSSNHAPTGPPGNYEHPLRAQGAGAGNSHSAEYGATDNEHVVCVTSAAGVIDMSYAQRTLHMVRAWSFAWRFFLCPVIAIGVIPINLPRHCSYLAPLCAHPIRHGSPRVHGPAIRHHYAIFKASVLRSRYIVLA